MIRIQLIGIFIFSFLLYSAHSNAQSRGDFVKLNYFDKIPPELDGCNGLYTYDSVSLNRKKYIIVTDLSEFALININGNQIRLKYDGSGLLAGDNSQNKKTFNTVYNGKNIQLILNTKPEKKAAKSWEESETWRDRGTLEIILGDRHVKIRVHGISGC
jgi:YD repeat-containing protein